MNIILLGGPGSGKGTQAKILEKTLHLTHVSSGDLFRENIRERTELGRQAEDYIKRGDLVPDEITLGMIRERLKEPDTKNGVIFDGFPRTTVQAEALKKMMEQLHSRIDLVLYINVSDDEIVRRLAGRLICKKCQRTFHPLSNPFTTCPKTEDPCQGEFLYQRDDDKPETVRARLKTYHRQTAPLIDYYKNTGLLLVIPGQQPIEDVAQSILEAVNPVHAGEP
jgi:adenylate kinase